LADSGEQWRRALAIVQTLGQFYRLRGRLGEWRALRTGLLRKIGNYFTSNGDRHRANLWAHLRSEEAADAVHRNDLAAAEAGYRQVLGYLASLHDAAVEPMMAVVYRGMGVIARNRQRLDEAEQWHLKALEIYERRGLERDAADEHHHLGVIAQRRERFSEAEQRFRQAQEFYERLGLKRDEADEYHHLGVIAQQRKRLDQAEQWIRKALEIYERLGLQRDAADEYQALGMIALQRRQYVEAEQWFREALGAYERLGNPTDTVNTLAQLGVLRATQGDLVEAVVWLGKALAIASEHKMPVGAQILSHLARLMKDMGEEKFAAAWRDAFEGQDLRKVQEQVDL
jgi:tetratricopeptide (TPR) repeat protein